MDSAKLAATDVELVLLPFVSASLEQQTELVDAAAAGLLAEVEELLRRPSDPNCEILRDGRVWSPIQCASAGGHVEVVRLLFMAGAKMKNVPFFLAAALHRGQPEMLLLLLQEHLGNRQVHSKIYNSGVGCLLQGPRWAGLETVRLLLKADEKSTSSWLLKALCRASEVSQQTGRVRDPEMVHFVLEAGTTVDSRQLSPALLVAAVCGRRVNVVRLLLEAGADANLPNSDGLVPLVAGVHAAHLEIVHRLLQAGARKTGTSPGGLTPLALAREKGYRKIAELLAEETDAHLCILN